MDTLYLSLDLRPANRSTARTTNPNPNSNPNLNRNPNLIKDALMRVSHTREKMIIDRAETLEPKTVGYGKILLDP